jgi:hypothetical protein
MYLHLISSQFLAMAVPHPITCFSHWETVICYVSHIQLKWSVDSGIKNINMKLLLAIMSNLTVKFSKFRWASNNKRALLSGLSAYMLNSQSRNVICSKQVVTEVKMHQLLNWTEWRWQGIWYWVLCRFCVT